MPTLPLQLLSSSVSLSVRRSGLSPANDPSSTALWQGAQDRARPPQLPATGAGLPRANHLSGFHRPLQPGAPHTDSMHVPRNRLQGRAAPSLQGKRVPAGLATGQAGLDSQARPLPGRSGRKQSPSLRKFLNPGPATCRGNARARNPGPGSPASLSQVATLGPSCFWAHPVRQ